MTQVSRKTTLARFLMAAVLMASIAVLGFSLTSLYKTSARDDSSPQASARPHLDRSTSSATESESQTADSDSPSITDSEANKDDFIIEDIIVGSSAKTASNPEQNTLYALIISLITSITSVLGLLMSKYTEWQRSRLEQMKLAVELQQKELELQEMRRKLQGA